MLVERYKRLVGKLDYLTVTYRTSHHNQSSESVFSVPRTTHLKAVMRILRYLKKAPRRGLLYSYIDKAE